MKPSNHVISDVKNPSKTNSKPAVDILEAGKVRWQFVQRVNAVSSQVKNSQIDERVEAFNGRYLVVRLADTRTSTQTTTDRFIPIDFAAKQ